MHGVVQVDRTAWKKDLLTFCDTFVCEGLEVGQQQAGAAPGDTAAVGGADAVRVPFRAKLVQKGAIKMLDLLETSKPARSKSAPWQRQWSGQVLRPTSLSLAAGIFVPG